MQSCGVELAEDAVVPELLGELMAHVAENMDAHARWVGAATPEAAAEQHALEQLARDYRSIAVHRDLSISYGHAERRVSPQPSASCFDPTHDNARRTFEGRARGRSTAEPVAARKSSFELKARFREREGTPSRKARKKTPPASRAIGVPGTPTCCATGVPTLGSGV